MSAKVIKELVFAPHGGVSLLRGDEVLWSSDDDEHFLTEFPDILDPNDEDDVNELAEYLIDHNYLDDNEDFDVSEEYLDDEKVVSKVNGPGDEEDEDDEDYDDE